MDQENKYIESESAQLQIAKQEHERETQKEDHTFQLHMQQQQHDHEKGLKDKDLGWLGKFFGGESISSKNITAFICGIMLLGVIAFSIVIYCHDNNTTLIGQLWDYAIPIITLSLGYLFGKN